MKRTHFWLILLSCLTILLSGCQKSSIQSFIPEYTEEQTVREYRIDNTIPVTEFTLEQVTSYQDKPYTIVNDNVPFFSEQEKEQTEIFLSFSELDELNRPHTAYALLSKESMPVEGEKRGEIGQIKPAGWHTAKYPDVIPDLYLYNRCHLIGWQLCGENANEKNLITGTRYLNVSGMLPFENQIANYLREDESHKVLYRVTPIYVGDNLVANGVLMEAYFIPDMDLQFCVYCYNVQPGIYIDYKTGENHQMEEN